MLLTSGFLLHVALELHIKVLNSATGLSQNHRHTQVNVMQVTCHTTES